MTVSSVWIDPGSRRETGSGRGRDPVSPPYHTGSLARSGRHSDHPSASARSKAPFSAASRNSAPQPVPGVRTSSYGYSPDSSGSASPANTASQSAGGGRSEKRRTPPSVRTMTGRVQRRTSVSDSRSPSYGPPQKLMSTRRPPADPASFGQWSED